MKKINKFYLF